MLKRMKVSGILLCVTLVAGCAQTVPPSNDDPIEAQNREIHKFNRSVDKVIVRNIAQVYGTAVPSPVRTGISNLSDNLSLPSKFVNHLLQADIEAAGSNAFRFLLNSTFGLAGLLDIATDAGIPEDATDFGETLFVWGVPEGTYMELPLIGPSTARHTVGRIVDAATNPLNTVTASPESELLTGTRALDRIGDRYRLSDLIDSVLHESADSYSQSRLLYLQNRRFKLSGTTENQDFDPYEDVYGFE